MSEFLYLDPTTSSVADLVTKFNSNIKLISDKLDSYTGVTRVAESVVVSKSSADFDNPYPIIPTVVNINDEDPVSWSTSYYNFDTSSWDEITTKAGVRTLVTVSEPKSYTFIPHTYLYNFWVISDGVTRIPYNGITLDLESDFYIYAECNNRIAISSADFLMDSISFYESSSTPNYVELFSVPSNNGEGNFVDTNGDSFFADEIIKTNGHTYKVTQARRVVLDGVNYKATEMGSDNGYQYFIIPVGPFGVSGVEESSIDFISSHFSPSFIPARNAAYLNNVSFSIVVYPGVDYNSVSDFNSILETEVENGHPVEFVIRASEQSTEELPSSVKEAVGSTDYSTVTVFKLQLGEYYPGVNALDVYRNGIRLRNFYDYVELPDTNSVRLRAVSRGDVLLFNYTTLANTSLNSDQVLVDSIKEVYLLTNRLNELLPRFNSVLSSANNSNLVTSIQTKITQGLVSDLSSLYNNLTSKTDVLSALSDNISSELQNWQDILNKFYKCIEDFNSLLEKYNESDSIKVRVIEAHFNEDWSTSKPYTFTYISNDIPAILKFGFISPKESSDFEILQKVSSIEYSHNTVVLHADERLPAFDAYLILYL